MDKSRSVSPFHGGRYRGLSPVEIRISAAACSTSSSLCSSQVSSHTKSVCYRDPAPRLRRGKSSFTYGILSDIRRARDRRSRRGSMKRVDVRVRPFGECSIAADAMPAASRDALGRDDEAAIVVAPVDFRIDLIDHCADQMRMVHSELCSGFQHCFQSFYPNWL